MKKLAVLLSIVGLAFASFVSAQDYSAPAVKIETYVSPGGNPFVVTIRNYGAETVVYTSNYSDPLSVDPGDGWEISFTYIGGACQGQPVNIGYIDWSGGRWFLPEFRCNLGESQVLYDNSAAGSGQRRSSDSSSSVPASTQPPARNLPEDTCVAVPKSGTVNIRELPSTESRIVGSLSNWGQVVEVIEGQEVQGESRWAFVFLSETEWGYVSLSVVDLEGPCAEFGEFGNYNLTTDPGICYIFPAEGQQSLFDPMQGLGEDELTDGVTGDTIYGYNVEVEVVGNQCVEVHVFIAENTWFTLPIELARGLDMEQSQVVWSIELDGVQFIELILVYKRPVREFPSEFFVTAQDPEGNLFGVLSQEDWLENR